MRLGIFLSGRGSNFVAIYEAIRSGRIKNAEIAVVFSNNPDAKGLEYAKDAGIDTVCIPSKGRKDRHEYDIEITAAIERYNIDLICLAGYMRIVTPALLDAYKDKIINIHPALLPAFPGLDAQKQALSYGVKITGCTVHFVDGGVDSGAIIMQSSVIVDDDDNEDSLSAKILRREHIIYPATVALFAENRVMLEGRRVKIRNDDEKTDIDIINGIDNA